MSDTRGGAELWYRVEDYRTASVDQWERVIASNTEVVVLTLRVVKRTPKGVWLDSFGYGRGRFVRLDAKKRYACPSRAEAFASFRARKERQLSILRGQIAHVERALRRAETMEGAA